MKYQITKNLLVSIDTAIDADNLEDAYKKAAYITCTASGEKLFAQNEATGEQMKFYAQGKKINGVNIIELK